MTELAALNIRITGDAGDLKAAVSSATGELNKVGAAATSANRSTGNLTGGVGRLGQAAGQSSFAMRNMSQQLSQVGQQAMATGNVTQALAIQLPDIGIAFGAIGAAAGLLAGIALPMLVAAFGNTGEAAKAMQEAMTAAAEATAATQSKIDQLRFGVDEEYQVEILQEQIRLQAEYNQKVGELNAYLATTSDTLDRQKLTTEGMIAGIQATVDAYARNDAALRQQEDRMVQLAILEGQRTQRANELAAAGQAAAAAEQRRLAAVAQSLTTYARTRVEGEKIADAAERAGVSASQLAHISFGNISSAASEALRLAGNLGIALDTASRLAALGPQGIGGNDPSGKTYSGRGGAPSQGDIVDMRVAGSFGYRTPPALGAGGGGGGGGGGGENPIIAELEALQLSLASQEEAQIESFARQQETLQQALAQRLITQQEYAAMTEAAQREHQEKMSAIDVWRYGTGLEKAEAFMGGLSEAFASGNDKMQKAARTFGAIEALINAWRAYSQTLADPSLPFFAKFAAGAKVLAAGMSAVRAIKSGGSGGGGASGGGSVSAAAPLPVQNVNIQWMGGAGFDSVSKLVDALNDGARRGYRVNATLIKGTA